MKLKIYVLLAVGITCISPQLQAQDLDQITEDTLQTGDVVVFQEVRTGLALGNGNQANLTTFTSDNTSIQFIVEGNHTNGYQFLVKSSSDGIAGNHAASEVYLNGGSNAWDVYIKAYNKNCTWNLDVATSGIFKIKNSTETGSNYIGVNYADQSAGYPLWRDKADYSYDDFTTSSTYGIFWRIYKVDIKGELMIWLNKAYQVIDETTGQNGESDLKAIIAIGEDEANSPESTQETVADMIQTVKKGIFTFLVANATGDTPVDVTAYALQNADMENGTYEPWVDATNISDFHTQAVSGHFTLLTNNFLQTWNSTSDAAIGKTGKVYQLATGLPNGTYKVTAAYTEMWEGQEEDLVIETGTNAYLFANDSRTELAIDKLSYYGFPTIGGRTATVDNVVVSDGTLQLGTLYEGAHMTVSALDNVQLFYKGFNSTEMIAALQKQIDGAKSSVVGKKMQQTVSDALNQAITKAENVIVKSEPTKTELEEAGTALGVTIANADTSITAYTVLSDSIANANVVYATATGGNAVALNTAIVAAQSAYDAALENAAEARNEAIKLGTAVWTYLLSTASATNPLNMTSFIPNADMESGSASPWIDDTNISDFHTQSVDGHFTLLTGNFLQTWNGTDDAATGKTGRVYQIVSGLPNGVYTLSAAYTEMWEGQEEDLVIETGTGIHLYGNAQQTELTIDKESYFGFPTTGGRTATVNNVLVTDGTLEVGVRYEAAHMTVSALDNVTLSYLGTSLVGIDNVKAGTTETVNVFNAEGGVTIETATQTPIAIYTEDGRLVKTVSAAAGSTFVSLKAGIYLIKGKVFIVK